LICFVSSVAISGSSFELSMSDPVSTSIAANLQPIIAKHGKSFVKYSEEAVMSQSKIDSKKILEAKLVLLTLGLQSWTIQKSTMLKAMELIVAENKSWKMTDSQVKDYIATMTKRLRNMIWGVAQGIKKGAKWAEAFKLDVKSECEGGESEINEDAESEIEDPEGSDLDIESVPEGEKLDTDAGVIFGWDKEMSLGFRVLPRNRQKKDYSLAPTVTGDAVKLEWLDGTSHVLDKKVFNAVDFKRLQTRRRSNVLAEYEHCETHNKVTIGLRVDRHFLVSVYEQNKQILQIRLDMFGDLSDVGDDGVPSHDHPAVVKCKQLMSPMVQDYCNNTIKSKADLVAARDNVIKTNALVSPKILRKRPAAKSDDKPTAKKQKPDITPDVELEQTEDTEVASSSNAEQRQAAHMDLLRARHSRAHSFAF
jgi:hypothetical protein